MPFPETPVSPAGNTPEYSVSELSGALRRTIERDYANVRVRGELGRVTVAKSGHLYVDLKDAQAVLSSVMWKGVAQALRFRPEEGMEVIATGRLTTFPGQSRYQLVIERLEPAGTGALLQMLEERRRRLAAEGLFDPARKRPIPLLPDVIGVVTSPSGAVIRDILHRVSERFASHVVVWPVLVQGEKAADQIARAINGFSALGPASAAPRPDVVIVARGGGSIEDLWAFNEEVVVRAAAACTIPLISAVGHETDTTLIDFAADLRAPTPTGAAEKAVPVRADLRERLRGHGSGLDRGLRRMLDRGGLQLRALSARLPRPDTLLALPRQRLDLCEARLTPALRGRLERQAGLLAQVSGRLRPALLVQEMARRGARTGDLWEWAGRALARRRQSEVEAAGRGAAALDRLSRQLDGSMARAVSGRTERLEQVSRRLEAVSHHATLQRGYAVVRDGAGQLVTAAVQARAARSLRLTLADGDVTVQPAPAAPVQGTLF